MQVVCAGTKTLLRESCGCHFTRNQDVYQCHHLKAGFMYQILVKYVEEEGEKKPSATCLFLHAVFLRLNRQ